MSISVYNSLSRQKETFESIIPGYVGVYVCGPTVYGDPHLGHARSAIVFDIVHRYLKFVGNKVRFVRNVTDVGHLENDADEGEDKIAKKARLEQIEPMEVAHYYTLRYRKYMDELNCLSPSIEPQATGHIMEQIDLVKEILAEGLAYETNGSVYFDVETYSKNNNYGELSGKVLEDLMAGSRTLDGQDEKKSPVDFALWKKATDQHIMKWESPWSVGYPGWHLECTAMSTKYLGKQFDIHGGGMDLQFPHHEAEIAQSRAAHKQQPAKYWLHNNMLTINGQKMSKSLGNFITLEDLFSGEHDILEQAYDTMTVRFFVLQAHYRSTIDFSNSALQAAEKGYKKLSAATKFIKESDFKGKGESAGEWDQKIEQHVGLLYDFMNDDFNTARALASMFELSSVIFNMETGLVKPGDVLADSINKLREAFVGFFEDVMGFKIGEGTDGGALNNAMNVLIKLRNQARTDKNFQLSDIIRDELAAEGILLKDGKDGTSFEIK